jgi:hypothetical protein
MTDKTNRRIAGEFDILRLHKKYVHPEIIREKMTKHGSRADKARGQENNPMYSESFSQWSEHGRADKSRLDSRAC